MKKYRINKHDTPKGITGVGDDYGVYHLTKIEILISIILGFAAFSLGMMVMFGSSVFAVICGIAGSAAGIYLGKKIFKARRDKLILLQFRSFLDALSNAFSAGCNMYAAINESYQSLKFVYGENAIMSKEVKIIRDGINNGYTVEELIDDWQKRMHTDCISDFADTMTVALRSGGNLGRAAADCREILTEKIETEMEIRASVASGRNELNILSAMPFVVTAVLRFMGSDALNENSVLNIGVKIAALAVFCTAYFIGWKITDIKV